MTSTIAERAFLLNVDFDGRADTLSGDLHQTKLTERQDGVACLVARHLRAHKLVELLTIFGFGHVDEVDDDNATHIAEAKPTRC